ncbi:MAG: ComEC/Rec2 family competence protein [Actinomycetota bacterium]
MRAPSRAGWWALAAAAAIWTGAGCGLRWGIAAAPVIAVIGAAAALRWRAVGVVLLLATSGALSGSFAASRIHTTMTTPVPAGPVEIIGVVAEDSGRHRPAVVRPEAIKRSDEWQVWGGPPLGVGPDPETPLVAGERVRIAGVLRPVPGRIRGDPVAARVSIQSTELLGTASGPFYLLGNAVRDRVRAVLDTSDRSQALVAGFLIGDTSGLGPRDLENLRRTGLTHFVAVSGSNVALFLAGWWVVTAIFGIGPVRRFALGVAGLGIFVVATRWEASVLRAAFMASLVLAAAAAGVAVDAWVAVAAAVGILLLVSGQLAVDVGFQLSVAATIGILAGSGMFSGRRPRALWATLGAATAAQMAVVPVLLWHFGTVPLMSPIANLLSAPLVTGATVAGSFAVIIGWGPAVVAASQLAGLVLMVADLAADWPQLGAAGVVIAGVTGAAIRWSRTRSLAVAGVALAVAVVALLPGTAPAEPTVTFLDVGQGDAVLLRDPDGGVALIDGGRDPLILAGALRRHGIDRIDLLVTSHGDVDHVGGFDGIVGDHPIGRLWIPDQPDPGPELGDLIEDARTAGIPLDRVGPGIVYRLGSITIEALGPKRRYLSRNDGSIVLWVEAGETLLLPGDIEATAQNELPPLQPDILQVPHHGASTTDARWLARTVGRIAVISVGQNTYGHPTPEILAVLDGTGAEIRTTMDKGDISIELGER